MVRIKKYLICAVILKLVIHAPAVQGKKNIEEIFGFYLPAISNNPHAKDVAHVRVGNALCDEEINFLALRMPLVNQVLTNLGITCPAGCEPRIAVACSGGGYRAMLYTVGALKALSDTSMLAATTYLLGLSGSTWAIAPWISSGASITAFHDWLVQNVGLSIYALDSSDFDLIEETIATKYFSDQPIGFVDVYGAAVANDLFDFFTTSKSTVHLSDQSERVAHGELPLPIYTAVSSDNLTQNQWYEFTPYEVGATWLNAYVPTWAYGRNFAQGVSTSNAPEQPLGTFMGTFGLAVGISLKYLLQDAGITDNMKSAVLKKIMAGIIDEFGNDRIVSAQYLSFVAGLENTPLTNQAVLNLDDGGIAFNLPYPPVSGQRAGRAADIIIFVEASAGVIGVELQKAEVYARANKLPFPPIDYTMIDKKTVSVFADATGNAPIIIYVPRILDQSLLHLHQQDLPDLYASLHNFDVEACIDHGACNTFNFIYTAADAQRMSALGEFNMHMAQDSIRAAINRVIEVKSSNGAVNI